MLVSDAARGPLMLIIPVLYWTHHLSFAALLVATFAIGCFAAPYFSSARLVLPDVVGEDERLVTQANAIFGAAQQITQILGPVLAGVLIAVTSPATVLVIDGATYVFAFLTILLVVRGGKRVAETPESKGLLAGMKFLMRDPLLGPMVIVACLINMVAQGLVVGMNTLAYFQYDGSARIAGFLFGAFGVGALGGALLAQQLAKKVDLLKLAAFAMIAMPLPLFLLAVAMPWGAVMAVVAAFAFFSPIVNAPIVGILTVRTPAALRPKVITAVMTVASVAGPIGFLGAGLVLAHVSVFKVFFAIAAALTVGSIAFAVVLLRNGAAPDVAAVPDVAHG
jgi:MFS family permease